MKVTKAPNIPLCLHGYTSVFLAGSIEMGNAQPWQDEFCERFFISAIHFFNPRRDDWDSSWTQDMNNPCFYQQVTWELEHIELADVVVFYFDPNTKSPITLMELGLVANDTNKKGRVLVCCPDGFWRKGNVDIVCQTYGIPAFTNIDTMGIALRSLIRNIKGSSD